MKVLIYASMIAICACARLENNYLPPPGASQAGGGPGLAAPGFGGGAPSGPGNNGLGGLGGGNSPNNYGQPTSVAQRPSGGFGGQAQPGRTPQAPSQQQGPQQPPIEIISYENENNGDGSYRFSYETANGIKAEEQGEVKNKGSENEIQSVKGSYSYTAPDGQLITVTYIADENGFQPQGDHLPTPPPIPEAILKSLQSNAAAQGNSGNPAYPSGPSPSGGQGGRPSGPATSGGQGYPSGGPSRGGSGPSGGGGNQGYPSGGPSGGGLPSQGQSGGRPVVNQYIPPNQGSSQQGPGQRPSGNGNFSPQSGYKY